MRILIDIGHPAHVHLFKNLAFALQKDGHKLLFTARDKEHELFLLEKNNLNYVSFGRHYNSKTGKIFGLLKFNIDMLKTALNFKPDLFISHGSIYAAHISGILRKPHISLEDSGNMEQIRLYRPFTEVIITPDILPEKLGAKQITYQSYHELAYLHPNHYKPDRKILDYLNLQEDEKYVLLRFVSWKATHDAGHKGLSLDDKREIIKILKPKYKIFISSEAELPDEFEEYHVNFPPDLMHDALYYASLFIGEGATMASEAGVLGTIAVYINSIKRSYCEDQQKYGLVYSFQSSIPAIDKVKELVSKEIDKNSVGRGKLLEEKIDLSSFLVWFIQNYPKSLNTIKDNPSYQYRFK